MTRFLQLFPQYRSLETRAESEYNRRLAAERLQVQLEAAVNGLRAEVADWKARIDAKDEALKALNEQRIEDQRKYADALALVAMGRRIFSKADPVPANYEAKSAGVGRKFARTAVAEQTQQVLDELKKSLSAAS